MPCEAKYIVLELFCTSRTWLAELVTWQVWTAWLSQLTGTSVNGSVDKWCYAFSAGRLLAASSLHCVNCRLNLNPCCDRKSRATCTQSFAPWQQATIEIMLAISLTIACSRYIYKGVILHAHPVHGESYNQRNSTRGCNNIPSFLQQTTPIARSLCEGWTRHDLHILVTAPFCCDRKSQAAFAQSFAPWQQATIEIMLAISLTIACSHYIYNGVVLHAHPVCGEPHNQRNTTGEVATPLFLYVLYLSRDHFNQLRLTKGQIYSKIGIGNLLPTVRRPKRFKSFCVQTAYVVWYKSG